MYCVCAVCQPVQQTQPQREGCCAHSAKSLLQQALCTLSLPPDFVTSRSGVPGIHDSTLCLFYRKSMTRGARYTSLRTFICSCWGRPVAICSPSTIKLARRMCVHAWGGIVLVPNVDRTDASSRIPGASSLTDFATLHRTLSLPLRRPP